MMSQTEILDAIRSLPPAERLAVAEATLQSLREEVSTFEMQSSWEEKCRRLAEAAQIALPHYQTDSELTIFTALDGEDFHEYEAK